MRLAFLAAFVAACVVAAPAMAGDLSPAANAAYLTANRGKAGVIVRPSGLQYRVLHQGNGRQVQTTDTVQVRYKGWTIDGVVFDETKPGDPPAEFPANRLIAGWVEALAMMKVGDRWQLVIPSNLAYGANGAKDQMGNYVIQPNQTLVFEMEVIGIK